jgi:signal transduction histidine kinase
MYSAVGGGTVEAVATHTRAARTGVPSLAGDEPIVLGAAAALAARFDVPPLAVRLAFVVLSVAGGWGVPMYGVAWALLVFRQPPPSWPDHSRRAEPLRTLAVAMVVAGLLLVLQTRAIGFAGQLVWPVAVVALGLAFLWQQLDNVSSRVVARATALRVLGGIVLVAVGLGFLLAANLSVAALRDGLVAGGIVLAGTILMFAPWVFGLTGSLVEEQRRRIRADERAEVAAHLHDSVLQTLTLIQKRADDPHAMAALARQQERELRRWLYGQPDAGREEGFRDAIDRLVADVEDQFLAAIDHVTVGDAALDEGLRSLLAATREAVVNAAKFSGSPSIALYAEIGPHAAEVFVRDRGVGFSVCDVAPDRRGIADSIRGRMSRAGGSGEVRSTLGEGTEVHLLLPRRLTAVDA